MSKAPETFEDADLRGDTVTLLSSDTTYLVPPGVDLVDWYADNIIGLFTAALDAKAAEIEAAKREARIEQTEKIMARYDAEFFDENSQGFGDWLITEHRELFHPNQPKENQDGQTD
jgi:hypothetical protein